MAVKTERECVMHVDFLTLLVGLQKGCLACKTSCVSGDTICLHPLQLDNIYLHLFARWQCCSCITISSYLFAKWHLFRRVGYLRHQ